MYKLVLDDRAISDENKIILLDNVLNLNKLSRHYILYFIFTKHGDFYTHEKGIINSYTEYMNYPYNTYDPCDPSGDGVIKEIILYQEDNLEVKYNYTDSQHHFISWLYYSGLYDYLIGNIQLTKQILDEMNQKYLLNDDKLQQQYNEFIYQYNMYPLCKNYREIYDSDTEEADNWTTQYNIMLGDIDKYKFLHTLIKTSKIICKSIIKSITVPIYTYIHKYI